MIEAKLDNRLHDQVSFGFDLLDISYPVSQKKKAAKQHENEDDASSNALPS